MSYKKTEEISSIWDELLKENNKELLIKPDVNGKLPNKSDGLILSSKFIKSGWYLMK